MDVKVKILNKDTDLPQYATDGAAAVDLRAAISEPIVLDPGQSVLVPTGIAIELPSREVVALLYARSGLATRHGLCLANGVGVIDSDYRGEIKVALLNTSKVRYTINPNERVAQMCIAPVFAANFVPAAELGGTSRGCGGFGSTGRD